MNILVDAGMILAGALLVYVLIKLLSAPIKWVSKLLINALLGLALLFAVNLVSGFYNVYIPINWVSILVAALTGIPGTVLLILIHFLF